jgi:cytochrome d ubiquinol oxidase subunit II
VTLADLAAAAMLLSLIAYCVLGGADFGGGVWDLLAFGPRAEAQRRLADEAIAPVWEANHVWLILIVVLLFSCFPSAFAAASIALHVPLTLMLLGIVLRGSAWAFRRYGRRGLAQWSRVFAVSSTVTPVFLGICLGAVTGSGIRLVDGLPAEGFFGSWLEPFPIAVGVFALAVFAFLAAVYLAVEAPEGPLREDFRLRAILSGLSVGLCALAAALLAGPATGHFGDRLLHAPWSWPLQIATGAAALGAFAALFLRRYRAARALAVGQVSLIVLGWGLAQWPYLLGPELTIRGSAAPDPTLRAVLVALAAGSLILLPSLWWLFRVFKRSDRAAAGGP